MNFQVVFSDRPRPYTGVELRPHFLLSEMGIKGSAIGAFIGPCRVETQHLVDWEDRLVSDRIEARLMVHLIGEFFGMTLREGVWAQRLIVAILKDQVDGHLKVRREGDDLFIGDRKLTVSIVTVSPVSVLFHLGINIDPAGAPVPAIGLAELGVDVSKWIPSFLEAIRQEFEGIDWACVKVRPVV